LDPTGYQLDPEWAWGCFDDGKLVSLVLAAPFHGSLWLMRLTATKAAPRMHLKPLLRAVRDDALKLGMKFVVTFVGDGLEERKLFKLCGRLGAGCAPWSGYFVILRPEVRI
jgi:hypothetical protein